MPGTLVRRMLDHPGPAVTRLQRCVMGALLTAVFAGVSLGRWLSRVREGRP